jgi:hypothetical protein
MAPVTLFVVVVDLIAMGVDDLGQLTSPSMLDEERVYGADQLPGVAQSREDVALFERLVETLDEVMDDLGAVVDGRRRRGHAGVDPANRRLVDQQDSLEDAVLSHQVDVGWVVWARGRLRPSG